jgi:hypothetical protein
MLKSKLFIAGLIVLVSFSSCGIFKKGCGCPPITRVKAVRAEEEKAVV